jgi:cytochrome c oxidase assembly protein subunit 15
MLRTIRSLRPRAPLTKRAICLSASQPSVLPCRRQAAAAVRSMSRRDRGWKATPSRSSPCYVLSRGCASGSAAVATAANTLTREGSSVRVGAWLLGTGVTVFGMVILGGVTRLTHSGLSMTEWRPQGTRPPMTDADWETEFAPGSKRSGGSGGLT